MELFGLYNQDSLNPENEEEIRKREEKAQSLRPLADRMRPESLEEYWGQKHLIHPGSLLWNMISHDAVTSMILWGPPGVGKTTLARIIAEQTKSRFITLSAVSSGVKEIRKVMEEAEEHRKNGVRTILFMDEIHRFNKSQQDSFLPYVEKGSVVLIGATTENPSFEVNSALLSRCRVFVLKALEPEDIQGLLKSALTSPKGFGDRHVEISDGQIAIIAEFAHGDARLALNTLEMTVNNSPDDLDGVHVSDEIMKQVMQKRTFIYDKKGDQHYDLISALHKSMRNSDVDACIYWLARMLEGGEDPLYIARRIVRMASEDIGMADSRALEICIAAYQSCQFLGMPECSVHLTHAITYLALAPKSNALETAYFAARDDARETLQEPVPLQICNAPTKMMEELGYGKEYEYSHDYPMHMTDMDCLPPRLIGRRYYRPGDQGSEPKVVRRMQQIESIKKQLRQERLKRKQPVPGASGAEKSMTKPKTDKK